MSKNITLSLRLCKTCLSRCLMTVRRLLRKKGYSQVPSSRLEKLLINMKIYLMVMMAGLCLAALSSSTPSKDKEKACIMLLKSYMGEYYVEMEDYAYKQSLDINQFKASVILQAYDKCLANITGETSNLFLSRLNETDHIIPSNHSDLVLIPDFPSLS